MTVTADTITDEQIRELRESITAELKAAGWPPAIGYDANARLTYQQRQCDVALGLRRASRGSWRGESRARCAEILNARKASQ